MARAGRKRKPTALRIVDGDDAGTGLVVPDTGDMPTPPEFLHPYALEEWNRLAPRLYAEGLITILDRAVFAIYCQFYGRTRDAEERLAAAALLDPATGGMVATTEAGNRVQSVLLTIANGASRDMLKTISEIGLFSPTGRARLEGKRGEGADPIAQKYFK